MSPCPAFQRSMLFGTENTDLAPPACQDILPRLPFLLLDENLEIEKKEHCQCLLFSKERDFFSSTPLLDRTSANVFFVPCLSVCACVFVCVYDFMCVSVSLILCVRVCVFACACVGVCVHARH